MLILGMNHYRECVDFWEDCFTRDRTIDDRIIRHIMIVQSDIADVKYKLLP